MTLLQLCDPLFKYICFLNRSARKGAPLEPAQVESEIEAILSDMHSKAPPIRGWSISMKKSRCRCSFSSTT